MMPDLEREQLIQKPVEKEKFIEIVKKKLFSKMTECNDFN